MRTTVITSQEYEHNDPIGPNDVLSIVGGNTPLRIGTPHTVIVVAPNLTAEEANLIATKGLDVLRDLNAIDTLASRVVQTK